MFCVCLDIQGSTLISTLHILFVLRMHFCTQTKGVNLSVAAGVVVYISRGEVGCATGAATPTAPSTSQAIS